MREVSKTILCPAHRCKPGSLLLGVKQDNGTIAILPEALPIDDVFIEKTKANPVSAERRFRFTNKCIEGGCMQWNGTGCNIADNVVGYLAKLNMGETIPVCSIRKNCRWYLQKGVDACKTCSFIPTEITQEEVAKKYAAIFHNG